jgi:hypothetical protein
VNETQLLQEIQRDKQLALGGEVLYLEGKTDVPVFFALLGREMPPNGIDRAARIFVRGLQDRSSGGNKAVRMRVEVARNRGYAGIYGILDGDGEELGTLASRFDAPAAGPLFIWKAYCIENLLAKTGWPPTLGPSPDWPEALALYAPYVALNRLRSMLTSALETLRLHRYTNPHAGEPLLTADAVASALDRDKHLLAGRDVAHEFRCEAARYLEALGRSMDEAHALFNGKWILNHLAPAHASSRADLCLEAWLKHAITTGGLPEVRSLWERIGRPA